MSKKTSTEKQIETWHKWWLYKENKDKPDVPFPKIPMWMWIGAPLCFIGFILLFIVPPVGLLVLIIACIIIYIPNYKEVKRKEEYEKIKEENEEKKNEEKNYCWKDKVKKMNK